MAAVFIQDGMCLGCDRDTAHWLNGKARAFTIRELPVGARDRQVFRASALRSMNFRRKHRLC